MNKIAFLFLSIFTLFLVSCEKEVDFNLNDSESKIVIEGSIENGLPPVVFLSKSLSFFSKIDLSSLQNSFLHDAEISVSNNQQTIFLKEYEILNQGVSYFFYSVDSSDLNALNFLGQYGESYHLKIKLDGKEFDAMTHIPFPKALDSLWSEIPHESEMPKDFPDSRKLYAQYTDPDSTGNFARCFTKRNREEFLPSLYSTYNDDVINGTTTKFQIQSGFRRGDSIDRETFGYFYKGDTVIVKWSAIDSEVYQFWHTLEFSSGTAGNPFASPIEVTTNIKGGALGVWAGYGSVYDTLIIQE